MSLSPMLAWWPASLRPSGTTPKGRSATSVWATAVAMVLVAGIVPARGQVQGHASIELGDLRAVPNRGSALVFQLPVISSGDAAVNTPTVVVRRPHNVVFFFANNTIEIRLIKLADIELEVTHAGQTINRLLLKTELQAAHARMLSDRRQNRASSIETPGNKAAGPARSSMAVLQQEMAGIRGEIQQLADHIATLADREKVPVVEHHREPWPLSWFMIVMLAGLIVAGLASSLTGCIVWRRRLATATAALTLPASLSDWSGALVRGAPSEFGPVMVRRVRVSHKVSRRAIEQTAHDQKRLAHVMALKRAQAVPSDWSVIAPSDREVMLATLWQELMSAQKSLLIFRGSQGAESGDLCETSGVRTEECSLQRVCRPRRPT